jgi:hypothetical protein
MARSIDFDDPRLLAEVQSPTSPIGNDASPVTSSLPLDSLTLHEEHAIVGMDELDQDERALLQWADLYRAYDVLNVIQVQTSTRKQVN